MTGGESTFECAVKASPALVVGDGLLPHGYKLILVLGCGRIEGGKRRSEGNKGFEEIPKLLIPLFPLKDLLAEPRRSHLSVLVDANSRAWEKREKRKCNLQVATRCLGSNAMAEVDEFGSVAWESAGDAAQGSSSGYDEAAPVSAVALAAEPTTPAWTPAVHSVIVNGATKELEGTKDMFVSYSVALKVSPPSR